MADIVDGPWPIEEISDPDDLYMRVHKNHLDSGVPEPGAFRNLPKKTDGMSTDWSQYSTPQKTQRRAISSPPEDNAVIALNVGQVRSIQSQIVEHSPIFNHPTIPNNRVHTDVFGPKNAETRLKFRRIYRMIVNLPSTQ